MKTRSASPTMNVQQLIQKQNATKSTSSPENSGFEKPPESAKEKKKRKTRQEKRDEKAAKEAVDKLADEKLAEDLLKQMNIV